MDEGILKIQDAVLFHKKTWKERARLCQVSVADSDQFS